MGFRMEITVLLRQSVKPFLIPSLRSFVKFEITRLVLERFGQVDAIAGVATGAIPQRGFSG